MKKEYIRPEAEMMKFVEIEELMEQTEQFTANIGSADMFTDWNL